MPTRPKVSDEATAALDEIKREYGYGDYDAAIRRALREMGYDV